MTNRDVCEKTVVITTTVLLTITFWIGVIAILSDIIKWIK